MNKNIDLTEGSEATFVNKIFDDRTSTRRAPEIPVSYRIDCME